jgi:2-hydroxychromene-2-carboxylate isomerase
MPSRVVDYYLTVTSPWTFLGHDEFAAMAKQAGAQVNVKAVDLGAVFQVSGGLPLPKRPVQRQRYRLFELQRWRRRRNIPLNLRPAFFPADHTLGNKSVLAATALGQDAMAFAGALMRGVWCADRNVADPAYIRETAAAVGIDGGALIAKAESAEIAAQYAALTEEAKERQVFGAPTYIIDGEPFWGQDRLDFVRDVLLNGMPTLPDATA